MKKILFFLVAFFLTSQTVVVNPARIRHRAIGLPITPVPIRATFSMVPPAIPFIPRTTLSGYPQLVPDSTALTRHGPEASLHCSRHVFFEILNSSLQVITMVVMPSSRPKALVWGSHHPVLFCGRSLAKLRTVDGRKNSIQFMEHRMRRSHQEVRITLADRDPIQYAFY